MPIRIQEMLRLSEASSQLTKLADDVVAAAGKVLTKNGEPFVALIDTRKLGYYRALEAEHRQPVVLSDIAKGPEDVLSGRVRLGLNSENQLEVLTLRTGFVRITKAYGGFDENRTQATVPPGHVTRDRREYVASLDYTKMGVPARPAPISP